MKFAHIADCHIGGWREQNLRDLGLKSFEKAIDICITNHTAFILISGDLFNTALPQIELIKETARILRKAKEHNIDIYIIPGSHDFSNSGKTMLDVLENSGLVENVFKVKENKLIITEDKTGVKLAGMLGRKGSLEKKDYENLDFKDIEEEKGFKIFMFHTALEEFKPSDLDKVDCMNTNELPKTFNYYAGGHVHYRFETNFGKGKLVFPGALFPNNFKELEEFRNGSFYLVDDKLNTELVEIPIKEVLSYHINANDKLPGQITDEILNKVNDFNDKIVLLRIEGTLKSGKVSDIDFNLINEKLKDSYIVLRNTNKLETKSFEEVEIKKGNVEDIEENIVKEHLGQIEIENEKHLIDVLMKVLNEEKEEGEKVYDFEARIYKNFINELKLKEALN
ncbi:MAG: DNA repair exonuclease [Candidatus Nanoarchaeia archaeon]|nr:DNA repair exonuclease [Candidatus Nanoarchaeia archaeon]